MDLFLQLSLSPQCDEVMKAIGRWKLGSRNSSGYLTNHIMNVTIISLVAQGVSQRQTNPSVTELLSGHSSVLDKMDKVQLQDLSQGHINTFLYLKRVQPNPSLGHLNSHTQKRNLFPYLAQRSKQHS